MCERIDLELRVYVTGTAEGALEWQVVTVEPDGQCCWEDGDVYTPSMGRPLVSSRLGRQVSLSLRHIVFAAVGR